MAFVTNTVVLIYSTLRYCATDNDLCETRNEELSFPAKIWEKVMARDEGDALSLTKQLDETRCAKVTI